MTLVPDLFELEASEWTLFVWSRDISAAEKRLKKTLAVRNKELPPTVLGFSPELFHSDGEQWVTKTEYKVCETPLFFENKLYEFDFQFIGDRYLPSSVRLEHPLREIEEAFRFSPRTGSLRGAIDFKNHVGRCRFTLCFHNRVRAVRQSIAFDVLPLKMDLETDLKQIQQSIESQYPSWLFSLAEKTQQSFGRTTNRQFTFPLLWLVHFTALRDQLNGGVRQILNAPHARLLGHTRYKKAERLKGRLSVKLEQMVGRDVADGLYHKHYAVQTERLSVDTPENRFVKMILNQCVRTLTGFSARIEKMAAEDNTRISGSFTQELNDWKIPVEKQLNQSLFREVGVFEGLNSESLVLQQKSGYATVYKVWQQLRLYLSVLGQQSEISVKPVSELYEVWCFLEIYRILCDQLGFTVVQNWNKRGHRKADDLLGLSGEIITEFTLERGDVRIKLFHEKTFGLKSDQSETNETYSWITKQRPDILLEVSMLDGNLIYWVFDAKYRIESKKSKCHNDRDYVPDDAINQMHRYRDALIHLHKDGANKSPAKSRPVFGAFALYPGWFNEGDENPYATSITEIGIGAFPLLPGQSARWLEEFLAGQLGELGQGSRKYVTDTPDYYYVQEASRIGYSGMKLSHYDDLVFICTLCGGRDKDYMERFREGTARWFHTRFSSSEKKNVERYIMQEIRQCAIPVHYEGKNRQIRYVYDVSSVRLVKRSEIDRIQTGSVAKVGTEDNLYWLFELGRSYRIDSGVVISGVHDYKFKLVAFADLNLATTWSDLPARYGFL